jgi:hypothetical protein
MPQERSRQKYTVGHNLKDDKCGCFIISNRKVMKRKYGNVGVKSKKGER